MKKITTLFKRTFEGHKVASISGEVTPGMEWVLDGKGIATVKVDGACCAVIDGSWYKRFDAKEGRKIPVGAIPCCNPDPVTGHWPHWVEISQDNPQDKWFWKAFMDAFMDGRLADGTYEAVGKHFNGNPYGLAYDTLIPHGENVIEVERTFDGIRYYLETHAIEGIVFWKDGEPQCKIKRSDFGFAWPVKEENHVPKYNADGALYSTQKGGNNG